jgi:hypothetical protein
VSEVKARGVSGIGRPGNCVDEQQAGEGLSPLAEVLRVIQPTEKRDPQMRWAGARKGGRLLDEQNQYAALGGNYERNRNIEGAHVDSTVNHGESLACRFRDGNRNPGKTSGISWWGACVGGSASSACVNHNMITILEENMKNIKDILAEIKADLKTLKERQSL